MKPGKNDIIDGLLTALCIAIIVAIFFITLPGEVP